MVTAFFDCSAGISGDMCLGALVDAGVPVSRIEEGLSALPLKGYYLKARKVRRASIAATKVDVIVAVSGTAHHNHRTWKEVEGIVDSSSLPAAIRRKGLKIFRRLFSAEGLVHGRAYNRTHLHELGAVDCMVDIFGTLIGLDFLGVGSVYASAVNLGSGFVATEHGRLPVPAPATAEILKGVPVYSSTVPFELTTPTGAAILREIADGYVQIPLMEISGIGYGAGQKNIKEIPNTLRIMLGESPGRSFSKGGREVSVLETNIDDLNPQVYEYVMERLFSAGALDVYLTPVIMKKGRPGVVLTVLCPEDKRDALAGIVFSETTTIGARHYPVSRLVLDREIREISTDLGRARIKIYRQTDGTISYSPEYEDCKRIARRHGMPLREVMKKVTGSVRVKKIRR